MAEYDWDTVREEYIYGYIEEDGKKIIPSHGQISKRHNIPLGTIKGRARKEQWASKRESAASKIIQKVNEKKTEYEAESIVLSDDKFRALGEKGRRACDLKLDQIITDIENKKYVRSIEIMNVLTASRTCQEIIKTSQQEEIGAIGVNQRVSGLDDFAKTIHESLKTIRK